MKPTVMSTAIMAIVMVVCSAGLVYAGGGGAGFGGVLFFQCYAIQGGMNPRHTLEVNDQFTNPTKVNIGPARLVCAPADGAVTNGQDITVIDPFTADHITCYDVAPPQTPPAVITLQDPFGVQTVRVAASQFVCVQAIKECVSGCPVLGP